MKLFRLLAMFLVLIIAANLSGADLSGANLEGAIVSDEQLKSAKSLGGAIMPDGSRN